MRSGSTVQTGLLISIKFYGGLQMKSSNINTILTLGEKVRKRKKERRIKYRKNRQGDLRSVVGERGRVIWEPEE